MAEKPEATYTSVQAGALAEIAAERAAQMNPVHVAELLNDAALDAHAAHEHWVTEDGPDLVSAAERRRLAIESARSARDLLSQAVAECDAEFTA